MNDLTFVPQHLRAFYVEKAEREGFTDGALGYGNDWKQSPTVFGTFYRIGYNRGARQRKQYWLQNCLERVKHYLSKGILLTFKKNRSK